MKTKDFFGMLLVAFLAVTGLTACCDDGEEEGRKVTDYKEYIVTVASRKLPGVAYVGCGSSVLRDVYAVKREDSQEWEQMDDIPGFDYESGYEWKIRISKTSYLDYNMGEPAWTEYKLLEMIAKERKESEGLPENFIPENQYSFCPITVACKVDAGQKGIVEEDLKTNPSIPYGCSYVFNNDLSQWALLDGDGKALGYGSLEKTQIQNTLDIPKVFQSFLPEEQIVSTMWWSFDYLDGDDMMKRPFYVVIAYWSGPVTKKANAPICCPWLYEDWTKHYQEKYPDAGVNAVVVRHTFL